MNSGVDVKEEGDCDTLRWPYHALGRGQVRVRIEQMDVALAPKRVESVTVTRMFLQGRN